MWAAGRRTGLCEPGGSLVCSVGGVGGRAGCGDRGAGGRGRGVEGAGGGVGASAVAEFAKFVAAAFFGWAFQASAEEFAASVWSQAGRPAGPPGWASGEGRCPDEIVDHVASVCEGCHGDLSDGHDVWHQTRQVFDLPEIRLRSREHRAHTRRCVCGHETTAAFPGRGQRADAVRAAGTSAGLVSGELSAPPVCSCR